MNHLELQQVIDEQKKSLQNSIASDDEKIVEGPQLIGA